MKTCRIPALRRQPQAVRGFTLVEIMIAIAIASLIASIAIPYFVKYRNDAQAKSCVANLKSIDGAKQQWALEHKMSSTDTPTWTELSGSGGYIKQSLVCPTTADYLIEPVGSTPLCDSGLTTHVLP
jgi:prepilin-type N-terminal cleavage/methylation domain-containing protein